MTALQKAVSDAIYVRRPGLRPLKLDLYLPVHGKPVPLLIWIHGGAWLRGDKDDPPLLAQLDNQWALASIQYHFSLEARFPAQIHACKAAVRWLRAHADAYGLETHRIGVMGASAGGHLAALLGASNGNADMEGDWGDYPDQSSDVQAVVDLFGPTDFRRMLDHETAMDHRAADSPEGLLLGQAIEEVPDRVQRANPITYLSAQSCPFLILHGKQDDIIPWQQSQLLDSALRQAGIESELCLLEQAGHGGAAFHEAKPRQHMLAFLSRHLQDG